MAPNFPHHIRGTVLWALGITPPAFPYGAVTLFGGPFQAASGRRAGVGPRPRNPTSPQGYPLRVRFGLLPFPSPVLRESRFGFFSSPYLDVSVRGVPAPRIKPGSEGLAREAPDPQEIPFGDPRINACMRLPGAFRSLPRPSSAPEPRHPPAGVVGSRDVVRCLVGGVLSRACVRGHCKRVLLPRPASGVQPETFMMPAIVVARLDLSISGSGLFLGGVCWGYGLGAGAEEEAPGYS